MKPNLPSAVLLALVLSSAFAAEPLEILLWPDGAPGSEGKTAPEAVRVTNDGEHVVTSVHNPSLTPYLPPKEKSNRAAVIIAPGGGHNSLWMDHEGYNLAKWLSERGTAAFVLKYRLARERGSTYELEEHALTDMKRALRLVRDRAGEWGLDPDRIGALGFSAGGELVQWAAMRFDDGNPGAEDRVERQGCKPAFQALIYPGKSGTIEPSTNSPPVFMVCGNDDRPDISEGLANVYLKFKKVRIPAELHVYAKTGHGFGVRDRNRSPAGGWPARFEEWMGHLGFLNNP